MKRLQKNNDKRLKMPGFTLIELLVVISIISLLLSITLPSLRRVRSQANAMICATQLRDIALALSLYAGDNRNAIPSSSQSRGELAAGISQLEIVWLRRLAPYYDMLASSTAQQLHQFVSFDLLRCTTQRRWKSEIQAWIADGTASEWLQTEKSIYRGTYAINTHFVLEAENTETPRFRPEYTFRRHDQISQPSGFPLIADGNGDIPPGYAGQDPTIPSASIMFSNFGPHPIAIDYGWTEGARGNRPPISYLRGPAPNHMGSTNYMMGDLSVQRTDIWPWHIPENWGGVIRDFHPRRRPGTAP